MEKINVLIVDDHHIVRHGLKLLFISEPQIQVIGDCGTGADALDFVAKNKVDVVISDITMSPMDGIELTQKLTAKYPKVKVMMLTMHLDEQYISEAMAAGAKAYLVKDSSERDIIEAVKAVHAGEVYLTKNISDILAKSHLRKNEQDEVRKSIKLTRREKEILKYIVEGLNNRLIGEQLNISERTVNAHRYNMMKKLNANNTADVVRMTLKFNLVD